MEQNYLSVLSFLRDVFREMNFPRRRVVDDEGGRWRNIVQICSHSGEKLPLSNIIILHTSFDIK